MDAAMGPARGWTRCSELDAAPVRRFLRDGYVVLRGVLDRDLVHLFADAAERAVAADKDVETSGRSFGRVALRRSSWLWQRSSLLRSLTFDERLARIVCDLLHVEGVRVIGDDVFCKPPGARVTGWHTDHVFVPIDRDQFASVWIPLAPVGAACGALVYAAGTHAAPLPQPPWPLRGETPRHQWYEALLRLAGARPETVAAEIGDVLVHHGRTLHMAHPNRSARVRMAFGIHYVDMHGRFVAPRTALQQEHVDASAWGGLQPGDEIAVPTAPIAFSR